MRYGHQSPHTSDTHAAALAFTIPNIIVWPHRAAVSKYRLAQHHSRIYRLNTAFASVAAAKVVVLRLLLRRRLLRCGRYNLRDVSAFRTVARALFVHKDLSSQQYHANGACNKCTHGAFTAPRNPRRKID